MCPEETNNLINRSYSDQPENHVIPSGSGVWRTEESNLPKGLLFMMRRYIPALIILFLFSFVKGQDNKPQVTLLHITENIRIDGSLSEESWYQADSIYSFTMVEPVVNAKPTYGLWL